MRFSAAILPAVFIATATALPHAEAKAAPGLLPGLPDLSHGLGQIPDLKVNRQTCSLITNELISINVELTATISQLYVALGYSSYESIIIKDFLLILVSGDLTAYADLEAAVIAKIQAEGYGLDIETSTLVDLQASIGINIDVDVVATLLARLDVDVHAFLAFWVQVSIGLGITAQGALLSL